MQSSAHQPVLNYVQAILGGKFCGLPLDQDNEDDQTKGRIQDWVEQLKGEGF